MSNSRENSQQSNTIQQFINSDTDDSKPMTIEQYNRKLEEKIERLKTEQTEEKDTRNKNSNSLDYSRLGRGIHSLLFSHEVTGGTVGYKTYFSNSKNKPSVFLTDSWKSRQLECEYLEQLLYNSVRKKSDRWLVKGLQFISENSIKIKTWRFSNYQVEFQRDLKPFCENLPNLLENIFKAEKAERNLGKKREEARSTGLFLIRRDLLIHHPDDKNINRVGEEEEIGFAYIVEAERKQTELTNDLQVTRSSLADSERDRIELKKQYDDNRATMIEIKKDRRDFKEQNIEFKKVIYDLKGTVEYLKKQIEAPSKKNPTVLAAPPQRNGQADTYTSPTPTNP